MAWTYTFVFTGRWSTGRARRLGRANFGRCRAERHTHHRPTFRFVARRANHAAPWGTQVAGCDRATGIAGAARFAELVGRRVPFACGACSWHAKPNWRR